MSDGQRGNFRGRQRGGSSQEFSRGGGGGGRGGRGRGRGGGDHGYDGGRGRGRGGGDHGYDGGRGRGRGGGDHGYDGGRGGPGFGRGGRGRGGFDRGGRGRGDFQQGQFGGHGQESYSSGWAASSAYQEPEQHTSERAADTQQQARSQPRRAWGQQEQTSSAASVSSQSSHEASPFQAASPVSDTKPKFPEKRPSQMSAVQQQIAECAREMSGVSLPREKEAASSVSSENDELSDNDLTMAVKRPGTGKIGRPIQLFANHFPVTLPNNMRVFHYDMGIARKFVRDKNKKKFRKPAAGCVEEVISTDGDKETVVLRREKWPKIVTNAVYKKLFFETPDFVRYEKKTVFDGMKNIFSCVELPCPSDGTERFIDMTIRIPDDNKDSNLIVKLKFVMNISVDLNQVFNRNLVERKSTSTLVLDVLLHHSKTLNPNFMALGRRIVYRPDRPYWLSAGVYHYPGVWESIRVVSGWKCTLNLDLANTAVVPSESILNIWHEIIGNKPFGMYQVTELESIVKGLKVDMFHRPEKRSTRCIGVTKQPASQLRFQVDLNDGTKRQITVADYFALKHKSNEFTALIQYPNYPCLQVGNKQKSNFVPLEFCSVKEQRYDKKLSDIQTSNMLKAASQPAPERKRRIEEEAKRFAYLTDPYLKNFGISVDLKMMGCQGRVLEAPTVEYATNAKIPPKDGGWNMRNVRLIKGCTVDQWAVFNTSERYPSQDEIRNFCYGLIKQAKELGITWNANQPVLCQNVNPNDVGSQLRNLRARYKDLSLVIVILPNKNTFGYSLAKSAGDVDVGVVTQCVLSKNVQKGNPPLYSNLLLKINAKLGGINNKLYEGSKKQTRPLAETVLIMGADVNHPSPVDPKWAPSIAAVVANVDRDASQYAAKLMCQERRKEFITDLRSAVAEMILKYCKRNGFPPSRIIMYRDGVGESMFLQVLTRELKAIRAACEDVFEMHLKASQKLKEYRPPITFIIVQKRHHTRLFCANERDMAGRGQNVPPGTTVDTTIVHPEEFDFYLCSHMGLQGTSRPTHYHVLWDDSNFTPDELQLLTYYLCHMYARATKSVSIPPPCYYADLLAYRGRHYLTSKSDRWDEMCSTSSFESGPTPANVRQMQEALEIHSDIKQVNGMFFV